MEIKRLQQLAGLLKEEEFNPFEINPLDHISDKEIYDYLYSTLDPEIETKIEDWKRAMEENKRRREERDRLIAQGEEVRPMRRTRPGFNSGVSVFDLIKAKAKEKVGYEPTEEEIYRWYEDREDEVILKKIGSIKYEVLEDLIKDKYPKEEAENLIRALSLRERSY
jgi:hypothetical protein